MRATWEGTVKPWLWHVLNVYVKTPVTPRLFKGQDHTAPSETREQADARIAKRYGVKPGELTLKVIE